jgi:hypothetical protein
MKEALLLLSILPRDIITPRSPDMTPPANTERSSITAASHGTMNWSVRESSPRI